ncbi:DUF1015 domain-containing protein [Candidatus Izemoplasma sp. B36]|uniref:DUF1015 domain-containing protein n=1 Tax=Candidatus Izemoplasma sp. B36 TaxID=3242468 RepID=UPI003557407F
MSFIVTPKILLPIKSIDMKKWAVIACDQFTSEPEYWDELKSIVDNVPSTYHLILPEAYLESNMNHNISRVNQMMDSYLRHNLFEEHEGFILVERKTPFVKRRLGLVIAIDLEEYQYEPNKIGKIRATEKTVPERIPPRVKIREKAPIELPHILVLVDDAKDLIVKDLYHNKKRYELLYDFDLNMNGGHIKGFKINDTKPIIKRIEALSTDISLIVGDGNHSLASAKVCWENIKKTLPEEELIDHPARYALVEMISLYDEGLTFEPIHRVLFNVDDTIISGLKSLLDGEEELTLIYKNKEEKISVPSNPFTTIKIIQDYLDEYLRQHKHAEIDFVHGLQNTKNVVAKNENSIGITMPPLKRDMLLPYIREFGVLPRKSFSLGEAEEKRYYLEGKRILK